MSSHFLRIANTPSVKAAQARHGSRGVYARHDAGSTTEDPLGAAEAAFIAARDSFYMATVSETGWPYIQHRGGPVGFLKVLDAHSLGFADFRGNRQYLTLGNSTVNPKVSLFLMDYPNRRRLKILGRLSVEEIGDDPALVTALVDRDYPGRPERLFRIAVDAVDWNCPQHITPRFAERELHHALDPIRARIAQLQAENRQLRAQLDAGKVPE